MRNSRTFISNRTSIEVGAIAHKLSAKKDLKKGNEILLVDMDGNLFRYAVV